LAARKAKEPLFLAILKVFLNISLNLARKKHAAQEAEQNLITPEIKKVIS
jgi:hypothetical protein